jgi:DNA-binding NarL/FixJ family response regulator
MTRKQEDVIRLLAEGYTPKQIADELGISLYSVYRRAHTAGMYISQHSPGSIKRWAKEWLKNRWRKK